MTETQTSAMPPQKKRKTLPEGVTDKEAGSTVTPARAVTLPPLQPYPHVVSVMPTHCYPIYSPYCVPVASPISPGPTAPSSGQKILPKQGTGSGALSMPASPSCFHPFSFQISPQLHPTPTPASGQNSRKNSTADEREQARKVSHSAIERRRRERINDKIAQLKQLIPSCATQDNLHKMSVLQNAIDYITYLKDVIDKAQTENVPSKQESKETETRLTCTTKHVPSGGTPADEDGWSASSGSSPCSPSQDRPICLSPPQDKTIRTGNGDAQRPPTPPVSTPLHPTSPQLSAEDTVMSEGPTRRLTPMDVIKQGPLPARAHSHHHTPETCKLPSPLLTPVSAPSTQSPPKNMSLKNLLCQ